MDNVFIVFRHCSSGWDPDSTEIECVCASREVAEAEVNRLMSRRTGFDLFHTNFYFEEYNLVTYDV